MTRKKLESIYYLRKELRMWQKIYNDRTLDIAPPVKNIDGMPYSKTYSISHPVEDKALKLAEANEEINKKIKEINLTIIEAENYIMRLSDSLIRQILEYRCVCNYTWKKIAETIGDGYTADSCRQQYHRFMERLDACESCELGINFCNTCKHGRK